MYLVVVVVLTDDDIEAVVDRAEKCQNELLAHHIEWPLEEFLVRRLLEVHEAAFEDIEWVVSAQVRHEVPDHVVLTFVKVWIGHVLILVRGDLVDAHKAHVDDECHAQNLPAANVDIVMDHLVERAKPYVDDLVEELNVNFIILFLDFLLGLFFRRNVFT